MSAHDFTFTGIDGDEIPLAGFRGRAVLLVNTASQCGYTPQYGDLQLLWSGYRDRGLTVLAVPSNDFGEQEPGDGAQIKSFCQTNYQIDFPITAKERVIGGEAHPFYRWVVEDIGEAAAPGWNFHKYLIAPDGSLAGLWPGEVGPLDDEITGTIDQVLADL